MIPYSPFQVIPSPDPPLSHPPFLVVRRYKTPHQIFPKLPLLALSSQALPTTPPPAERPQRRQQQQQQSDSKFPKMTPSQPQPRHEFLDNHMLGQV